MTWGPRLSDELAGLARGQVDEARLEIHDRRALPVSLMGTADASDLADASPEGVHSCRTRHMR